MRTILHIDMDAFFAAVEQRDHPEYRGKPVIVGADPKGGRGRGVVAACSYEARKFGIHSAMPISQAYRRCPGGIYVRPDGALYSEISHKIMEVLSRFSDRVEQISIDEAFIDATGLRKLYGPARELAIRIKETIREEQQLACSIGIAPNKFLAKLTSDLCKPDGLMEVTPGAEQELLQDLPVRRIWGVGPKTEKFLHERGIKTIGDAAARPLEFWTGLMGRHGEHIWQLAHGIDDRPVEAQSTFKSLSQETTFGEDTRDLRLIRQTLQELSEEVARRIRKQTLRAGRITLKLRYADFSTFTRQKTLGAWTDEAREIYQVIRRLLEENFLPLAQKVRLLGVGASQFQPTDPPQHQLFNSAAEKQRALNATLDAVISKFGKTSIRKASSLDHTADEEKVSSFLKR